MKIRTGKKSVEKRYGFRSGGGINHVRYDHILRPRVINVTCPNCKKLAISIDIESDKREFVSHMGPSWNSKPFVIKCTSCKYENEKISYDELPEPFHQIYVNGEKLWAYNWKHLDFIYRVLTDQNEDNHIYSYFETYIHGNWKKNKTAFSKAIKAHIIENDKLHEFSSLYHQIKNV
jgi:hypothetical protein